MRKFHEALDKITRMIYLINKGKYSVQELSSRLSVSKKTLQNYINYLKEFHGIHIYFDRSQNCYRIAGEGGKLVVEFKKDQKKDNDNRPNLA